MSDSERDSTSDYWAMPPVELNPWGVRSGAIMIDTIPYHRRYYHRCFSVGERWFIGNVFGMADVVTIVGEPPVLLLVHDCVWNALSWRDGLGIFLTSKGPVACAHVRPVKASDDLEKLSMLPF